MALVFFFGLSLLLCMSGSGFAQVSKPTTECRDGYFLLTFPLGVGGLGPPRVEVVDTTGVVYPITPEDSSQCGYTFQVLEFLGFVIFRASFFSCHTGNQDDKVFMFNLNIITSDHLGEEQTHSVSKTCSQSFWPSRKVICEDNYMEVLVQSIVPCPYAAGTAKGQEWDDSLSVAHGSANSTWQVVFLTEGQQSTRMSIDEARNLGYQLDFTNGFMVFRTTYGQPHSAISMINDIPVEVIHPILFVRQRWSVLMVDLVAACTMYEGGFDGATLHWETPTRMTPLLSGYDGFVSRLIGMGVDGLVLDEETMANRGYTMEADAETVKINIPYGAEGGLRLSFVINNVYNELYVINMYYEHVFTDDSHVETAHCMSRPMVTSLLPRIPFTVDQTVLEERMFTVYLGNFPFDVQLVAVMLNGQDFTAPEATESGFPIVEVPHTNGTHAYVIRAPFEDDDVLKVYVTEGRLEYSLDLNYTLNIMPQQDPYYHLASVVAIVNDVFPPSFNGLCTENGIRFKMDHQEFDYMWDVYIGHHPLTQQLAAQRGYVMQNDSQSLILDVPLFTIGYIYEDLTLQHFFAIFEILSRDAKTLEVGRSSVKRCLFETTELLVCSNDGVMTVVSDVTKANPGADPARTTLLDRTCRPKQTDYARVLFEFKLNTCATRYLVDDQYVIYENEIIFVEEFLPEGEPVITRDAAFKLTVRCYYLVEDVHRLFVDRKFRSESPGFGSVMQTRTPVKAVPQVVSPAPTRPPATTTPAVKAPSTKAPSVHVSPTYVRVRSHQLGRGRSAKGQ